MDGISFHESFLNNHLELFEFLKTNIVWDESMFARKTASFGKAYNYSQMNYPHQDFHPELNKIINQIEEKLGFRPNNCLINYYLDGKSRMGFHSDQTEILTKNTGVVIISLGATRILRFRNIKNKEIRKDFELPSGSLFYMNQEIQSYWQHAIPKLKEIGGRMSLTFRDLK